jgi:hypothetical protein
LYSKILLELSPGLDRLMSIITALYWKTLCDESYGNVLGQRGFICGFL